MTSKIGISRFQGIEIHQGLIEQNFLDFLPNQSARIEVQRDVVTEALSVEESLGGEDEYPITLKVRHKASPVLHRSEIEVSGARDHRIDGSTDEANITDSLPMQDREEMIKAKYVIGCDGAHSWTRHQVGLSLEDESSDDVWGVIDVIVGHSMFIARVSAINCSSLAIDRLPKVLVRR